MERKLFLKNPKLLCTENFVFGFGSKKLNIASMYKGLKGKSLTLNKN